MTHHDFVSISYSACIMILHDDQHDFMFNFMFSTHHDFARNCKPAIYIFVFAQTCPNSDVTKAMVNHRSHYECHLQPYKRFLQMTCSCGTPLIHISHAQNRYIKSGLLHQSFEFFFAFLDRVILGKLLKKKLLF